MNALEAVVLAAGAGVRFGGDKLTAPRAGGVLLASALAAAFAAPARAVTVVWGADPAVPETARRLAGQSGQTARLRLVHNPDHAEGMGASLRAGVAALPADSSGVFVFLGDMPRVPHAIAGQLADSLTRGSAVAPLHGGRRGHPVLFDAALLPPLLASTGDQGAGRLLASLGDRLVLVTTDDDGVLFDVDTRSDP
ncbi:MAG: nucleotidyltransferase family protein [Caulobacter sp.]|nr:nucleotidyltransferase family protein [Caulobacter sp.]